MQIHCKGKQQCDGKEDTMSKQEKITFSFDDGNIDENTLMICNGDIPVCIAGVMGGLDSEIVESTTKLHPSPIPQ